MAKTAPKNAAPTQQFIEIIDIIDNIVILDKENACIVIEVMATNFALLSSDEQNSKIYSYAALLNALSFPIQILIRSKRLDVSLYLKMLDIEKARAQTENLSKQIGLYRNFVQELVKVNTILDKKFYIAIPYSSMEKAFGDTKSFGESDANAPRKDFASEAKAGLYSKADAVQTQLNRLNLKSEILGKEKLTKLYYDIFNDSKIDHQETENLGIPIISGKENQNARS